MSQFVFQDVEVMSEFLNSGSLSGQYYDVVLANNGLTLRWADKTTYQTSGGETKPDAYWFDGGEATPVGQLTREQTAVILLEIVGDDIDLSHMLELIDQQGIEDAHEVIRRYVGFRTVHTVNSFASHSNEQH